MKSQIATSEKSEKLVILTVRLIVQMSQIPIFAVLAFLTFSCREEIAAPIQNNPYDPGNISGRTVLGAPSNLSIVTMSADSAVLQWKDNGSFETGFSIEQSKNGDLFRILDSVQANCTKYVVRGFDPVRLTIFRVRAVAQSAVSEYSNIVTLTLGQNLDQGLVAYYPFNGNADDESGNGNNGIGYSTTPARDRFGTSGNAMGFLNLGSNIRVANSSSLNPVNSLTISVWFNFVGGAGNPRIVSKWNDSPNSLSYELYTNTADSSRTISFLLYSLTGSNFELRSKSMLTEGLWYHAVVLFDGTAMKIYINGALDTSMSASFSINQSASDLLIGEKDGYGGRDLYQGSMDDIRLYNRALNGSEIQALYHEAGWGQNLCPPTVPYLLETYNTALIGTQCWLKENLNVGTMIQATDTAKDNGTIEKYCYNNDTTNCSTYGGLYQWDEAMQYSTTEGTRGICPPGWHIPTSTQLQDLEKTVGKDGNKLLARGEGDGTNESGFSALLAGSRTNTGVFYSIGSNAYFWSSAESNSSPIILNLYDNSSDIGEGQYPKNFGFSVRCLMDLPAHF